LEGLFSVSSPKVSLIYRCFSLISELIKTCWWTPKSDEKTGQATQYANFENLHLCLIGGWRLLLKVFRFFVKLQCATLKQELAEGIAKCTVQ
jgi:hypothetical protein